jgi:hypothetical protein
MKFPDRPVLNGILAVICALVVLGLLSTPALVGQQASPFLQAKNVPSSNSAGSASSSSYSTSGAIPATSLALTSSSSTTLASNTPAGQTFSGMKSNESVSVSGSSNFPIPSHSTANNLTIPSSTSAGMSANSTSMAAQTNTTVNTTVTSLETAVVTQSSSSQSSSLSSTPLAPAQTFGAKLDSQTFQVLGILSISSVIIAVGSMLFVYRRVSREDNTDE